MYADLRKEKLLADIFPLSEKCKVFQNPAKFRLMFAPCGVLRFDRYSFGEKFIQFLYAGPKGIETGYLALSEKVSEGFLALRYASN